MGWREWLQSENVCSARELVVLCVMTALLLFYGLVPFHVGRAVISRPDLGLVGADEPRYAQIAEEMLQQHSDVCHRMNARVLPRSLRPEDLRASYHCAEAGTITPILYGHPWLEKPALYYWRTMSFYKEFGHSDWVARLPSATGAYALVFLIFLHMRRFRPGGHLDAALITAASVAIIAFARGASTDMQLAAPFCMGMLGWYAWYETGKKFWLFDLYFFGGLATLAKGPVAIFLSLGIILLFVGLRREWGVLRRMIWLPGIALFLAISLPWFIAVQLRNPTFYKFFLFEQNLQRFATDRYQHRQTPFFYVVVLLLALIALDSAGAACTVGFRGDCLGRVARPTPARTLPRPHARGRCLSRVPGALGGLSHRVLFPFQDRSCPATFCHPFLRLPSSPATISFACGAAASRTACSSRMERRPPCSPLCCC